LDSFIHGGNIFYYAKLLGCNANEIIDLSSNISPFVNENIFEFIKNQISSLKNLPSSNAFILKEALANKYDKDMENFVVGTGTSEIIKNLCLINSGKKALIIAPTYIDYEKYCKLYNLEINFHFASEKRNFAINFQELDFSTFDIVFICNPNNPTGYYIEKDDILRIAKRFENCMFVIDESYLPFMSNSDNRSLLFEKSKNIIVLRSFSKIYGLAGLRIGYAFSYNKEIIRKIEKHCLEWGVNSLSEVVGKYLLSIKTDKIASKINEIKNYLYEELKDCKNIKLFSSTTNFVLIKLYHLNSEKVFNKLLSNKILIRDCKNIRGLDDSFIRLAIKDLDSMKYFLSIFKKIVGCEN